MTTALNQAIKLAIEKEGYKHPNIDYVGVILTDDAQRIALLDPLI